MDKGARTISPAFWIGCVTLADLAAGRTLLQADESRVYLLGRALNWQCGFHAATGLPCPTCGLTRSVVMSLHGEFARAWNRNGALAYAAAAAVVWLGGWVISFQAALALR